jgi:tellurite resistance protein TerC
VDFNWVLVVIQVIFLEGVLSIDNAAVLGAMVSVLPKQTMVPWPAPLQFLAQPVHRVLGGQQAAALKVGLLGAYFGRGLMLVLASVVIQNEFLKYVGAAYLIKLAFENLGAPEQDEQAGVEGRSLEGKGFWSVVLAVELADLAFSLDNVVAVIALSDNLLLVMFGVFMGIVTMRFAAGIFTWMIAREPILKAAAYMVVCNIGFELMLSEFGGVEVPSSFKFLISLMTLILFVVYAHAKPLHVLRPIFQWIAQGMANVNRLIDWALVPVGAILKVAFKLIWIVLRPIPELIPHEAAVPALPAAIPGDCGEDKGAGSTDEP